MNNVGRDGKKRMIAALVHHYAIPGKEAEAETLICTNGRNMRAFEGFVTRFTLTAEGSPRKISTVTVWETEEAQKKWAESDVRKKVAFAAGNLWVKKPEAEIYEVIPELT